MSVITKSYRSAKERMTNKDKIKKSEVVNHMGGESYTLDPLMTLKFVSASSFFGEPQYYSVEDKDLLVSSQSDLECYYSGHYPFKDYLIKPTIDRSTQMEKAIDAALDYDFAGTLLWAGTLRNKYYMRVTPQVIFVRAMIHPKRKEFTRNHKVSNYQQNICKRPDDVLIQMTYFLCINDGKQGMPSILKRSWKSELEKLNRYSLAKYKNKELGIINAVRLTHANNKLIDELMQTGKIRVSEDKKTWENLRSEGKSWSYILRNIDMGHMALLRNLRNFLKDDDLTYDDWTEILETLLSGVKKGKQFPFRYYSAYDAIDNSGLRDSRVLTYLEKCLRDATVNNFPKLKGKTLCLIDNSGSAHGAFTSEYGTVTVSKIANLSGILTAYNSDEGTCVTFGVKYKEFKEIQKTRNILKLTNILDSMDVGGATEGGLWDYLYRALEYKIPYDNIFIYSDMQAGTGGLYFRSYDSTTSRYNAFTKKYLNKNEQVKGSQVYFSVYELIEQYRKYVNPNVNVFCIQVAGYDNSVIPQIGKRNYNLYGWTGKEIIFANMVNNLSDTITRK